MCQTKKILSVIFGIAILLISSNHSIYSQKQVQKSTPSLGWDLTYSSVLERNKVAKGEWIWKWLGKNYESPVKSLIQNWEGEPIVASILIEHPAFHAGEHYTTWYVRTENNAFNYIFVKEKPNLNISTSLNKEKFDKVFKQVFTWRQGKSVKTENKCVKELTGFSGFLSLYNRGSSRQMLLNMEDFYIFESNDCEKVKPGRISLFDEMIEIDKP